MGEFHTSFQHLIYHAGEMLFFNYMRMSYQSYRELETWLWPTSPDQIKLEDLLLFKTIRVPQERLLIFHIKTWNNLYSLDYTILFGGILYNSIGNFWQGHLSSNAGIDRATCPPMLALTGPLVIQCWHWQGHLSFNAGIDRSTCHLMLALTGPFVI